MRCTQINTRIRNCMYLAWCGVVIVQFLAQITHSFVLSPTKHKIQLDIYRCPTYSAHTESTLYETDDTNDADIDWDDISDAEALLACKSFLQKRQKLGPWQQAAERRESRIKSLVSMTDIDSVGVNNKDFATSTVSTTSADIEGGFFWSNPEELRYFHAEPDVKGNTGTQGNDETTDITARSTPIAFEDSLRLLDIAQNEAEDELMDDLGPFEHFTVFDNIPPPAYTRRSQLSKQLWANATFREQWYKKRWGDKVSRTDVTLKQLRLEDRIKNSNIQQLMAHPALANMTQAEVSEAIMTYVTANSKRSVAKKQSLQQAMTRKHNNMTIEQIIQQGELHENVTYDRDRLLDQSLQKWKEKRDDRSMRSKRAYETRLLGQTRRTKAPQRLKRSKSLTTTAKAREKDSANAAMHRIEDCLDARTKPDASDVVAICEPVRLARRKEILCRVVRDCFGMRGKCVPIEYDTDESIRADQEYKRTTIEDATGELLYMTKCSYMTLARYIVAQL